MWLISAAFSGDWTPIHTDVVYAATQPFGQRIAHGMLGLSIAVALAVRAGFLEGTIIAFRGMSEWKFSLPIYIGDTIHAKIIVSETRAVQRLGGGMLTLRVEILNQEDKIIQQGNWSVLVKGKSLKAAPIIVRIRIYPYVEPIRISGTRRTL